MAAEYWPLAQTGGLAEAVTGLAKAQARMPGVQVTTILPLHRSVRQRVAETRRLDGPFWVTVGGERRLVEAYRPVSDDQPGVVFIGCDELFDRAGLYGESGRDYPDNALRFAVFARAAVTLLPRLTTGRTVLHAHDWHAGLASVYLRGVAGDPTYDQVAAVFTVHNAAYQGYFPRDVGDRLGLWSLPDPGRWEWYGGVNFLKGALETSDLITTVSPRHAAELTAPNGGFGLDTVFSRLAGRFTGILNGYDVERWDPRVDGFLPATYSSDDPSSKARCKTDVQRFYGLAEAPGIPLVAVSARLVHQKGLDLLVDGFLDRFTNAQFVFLGRGEQRYEEALQAVARRAPDRIAVPLAFSDPLEHRLLGGADLLLMPSFYEPCGLTQLRAMRYGALPVARKVGGLADSIEEGRTGFLFEAFTASALQAAMERAVTAYADETMWRTMVRRAMNRDFSWEQSATSYVALYHRALAERWATFGPRRRPLSMARRERRERRRPTPIDREVSVPSPVK